MGIEYINANWQFDQERFSDAMASAVNNYGAADLAEMLGLSEDSVNHWGQGIYNPTHPYPRMTNFLIVCNLLYLNPALYFWVGEGS